MVYYCRVPLSLPYRVCVALVYCYCYSVRVAFEQKGKKEVRKAEELRKIKDAGYNPQIK